MLIRNGTILAMESVDEAPVRRDISIAGDRIAAIAPGLVPSDGEEVIDAAGCIVVPGFIDTHRHMWQGVLRGHATADTLDTYFRRVLLNIGPALTPDDLALSEALSARAALDAGITTVQDTSDIHDSPERSDAVVAALQQSGLRVRFAYGLARPYVLQHGAAFPADVRRVRHELLPDDDALVTMGLETQNGDDDAERHNAALAEELGLPTAHHVRAEIRPSRLRDLGALRPGTTFVHGNGLGRDELKLIAESGGSLSIAPFVEMAMGLGQPMIADALTVRDLTISLSTDVEVLSPTDMFTQMRTLYAAARSMSTSLPLGVRDILRLATLGGAHALGLADRIGSITVGKQADLVLLRADRSDVAPLIDPYGTVVLQMDRSHVDTVLVAGTVHKRGGVAVGDDSALVERAQSTVEGLRSAGLFVTPAEDDPHRSDHRPPIGRPDPLEIAMSSANAQPGARSVPSRRIRVPETVSGEMADAIAAPYRSPAWHLRPTDGEGWRSEASRLAEPLIAGLPDLRQHFGVTSEPTRFGNVPGYLIRPVDAPSTGPRVLHIHGGGFVYHPGEAGNVEAVLLAGIGGFEVASVSYRLAYDAPFPAALDDVTAAWRALLDQRLANDMTVLGTSAGGALALSLVLRAKAEGIPLPAAVAAGSPWADLTDTGDSYRTNEWLDNVEVSYRGFLSGAATLYADGHDPRDPLLSPVYGDFTGAPPTILVSGTRDLFLSNTVRVHRALRQAGVTSQLHVFEGQSHAQYLHARTSPETREIFSEIATFFRAHLADEPHPKR
ncbi:MAG: 5-methylthioadenosine/S-adenosylhomocysteine deaminase [Pseudonocardiales bacterium]|jgi:5-methylthioadenosine/S-adenosylhomocysteine deaminase|nr:5-methylthioadenosine/S-adenosylhomocysteine deaminase [Pseudonocardiales bacterium]